MSKTFEDYDKRTVGDVFAEKLKVLGLGLAGALVGGIPYFVLQLFKINSTAMLFMCGACAMIFFAAFGKSEVRKIVDRLILIVCAVFGSAVTIITLLLTVTLPPWNSPIESVTTPFQKLVYLFKHSRPDTIEDGKIFIDAYGNFSIWTVLIAGAIFAVVGMYIAFVFVVISRNGDNKKRKK